MRIRLLGFSNRKMTNLGHHFGISILIPQEASRKFGIAFYKNKNGHLYKIRFHIILP